MKTELLLVIMAGVVLSLFIMVGEVAAMRKRAKARYAHLRHLYQSGKILRLLFELSVIAAFFLVQPVIVAALVAMALNNLNPQFSSIVIQELRQAF